MSFFFFFRFKLGFKPVWSFKIIHTKNIYKSESLYLSNFQYSKLQETVSRILIFV